MKSMIGLTQSEQSLLEALSILDIQEEAEEVNGCFEAEQSNISTINKKDLTFNNLSLAVMHQKFEEQVTDFLPGSNLVTSKE